VIDAFHWYFDRFASAILEGADQTNDVHDFGNSLVRAHLQHQLESPENHPGYFFMAGDRVAVPSETRKE
jgi:hypothetical protein